MEFPLLQFVPLVLSLDTTEESVPALFIRLVSGIYMHRYVCRYAPEPSLLQAEQSQLSQPVLVGQMLQSINDISSTLQEPLQYAHVPLVLRSLALDTALQMLSHQC